MASRSDSPGQIILLAGILLAISFVLFSVQLSLVASIGQQAGRDVRNPVIQDYLSIRQSIHEAIVDELTPNGPPAPPPTPDCADTAAEQADLGGRLRAHLAALSTHAQNRGMAFRGEFVSVTATGAPFETTHVRINIFLTDGSSVIHDSLQYNVECS